MEIMSRWLCGMAVVVAATLGVWRVPQTTTTQNSRAGRWAEDLDYLTAHLSARGVTLDTLRGVSSRGQKDFRILYPDFDNSVDEIKRQLPSLSDDEVVFRLMRLVASARVAHNIVKFPDRPSFSSRLPIVLYWYSDGLAIVSAADPYRRTLGSQVLKIGSKTPERLLSEFAPYISHENDIWLRQQFPGFLTIQAVLQHLDLLNGDGSVVLTLKSPLGEVFEQSIVPTESKTSMTSYFDALKIPVPLYRSQIGKHYWFRYLPDSQSLYVQYNMCENDPAMPFADFTRQVMDAADANPVSRLIIDLRQNGGGNSRIIRPLLSAIRSRRSRLHTVIGLIGPSTFSSAVANAIELRQELGATLIGEPTGGQGASYGEAKTIVLPNSGLTVQFTSKRFIATNGSAEAALMPDVRIPRAVADALAGRDPVLDAALGYKK